MPGPRYEACVEIGGIPISLSTSDQGFHKLLLRRYADFISQTPAEFELEFEIIAPRPATDDDVRVRRNGAEWLLERGDFSARWDPRTGTGLVRQNANPYSLDSVLRILHSLILAKRGGFLLHAASAICDGRAFLFSGVSGAGKTTMTRIATDDVTLLTDEISYVRPDSIQPGRRAENSVYRAFGTPFAGELAKAGENTSAPIAGLFFLEKGPKNRIDDLSSSEAVQRLMRNILFFAEDPNLVEELLATACAFVASLPSRRLTFYPDRQVWDEVRRFGRDPERACFYALG
ncbi:MAG TPA: hypothetical protein VMI10_18430 [Terriglobales bacterium]|nr:hypothetical protein [Terriglobales bacterium]